MHYTLRYTEMTTPIGPLLLAGREDGLHAIRFSTGRKAWGPEPEWTRDDDAFPEATRQLGEYFDGARRSFDLAELADPAKVPSGTTFQRDVLDALLTIPYGETRSYADIARQIGRPTAVRAVGAANGRNPLPIVIPCHRVIGSNRSLTGFGGGLEAKRHLLDLEARVRGQDDGGWSLQAVAAP